MLLVTCWSVFYGACMFGCIFFKYDLKMWLLHKSMLYFSMHWQKVLQHLMRVPIHSYALKYLGEMICKSRIICMHIYYIFRQYKMTFYPSLTVYEFGFLSFGGMSICLSHGLSVHSSIYPSIHPRSVTFNTQLGENHYSADFSISIIKRSLTPVWVSSGKFKKKCFIVS